MPRIKKMKNTKSARAFARQPKIAARRQKLIQKKASGGRAPTKIKKMWNA